MDQATIQKLVKKYLDGDCSEEEKEMVESWYNSFESRADSFVSLPEEQKEAVRRLMLDEINAHIGSYKPESREYPWLQYLVSTAAVIAVVLAFSLAFLNSRKPGTPEVVQAQDSQLISVVNSEKNILRVSLPDSSTIWLQPGAEVVYPRQFGKSREVNMKGDVFFEIHRDIDRPFIVYSSKILTKVLGTSFRVRDIENKETSTVSVLNGKVSVKRIPPPYKEKEAKEKSQQKDNEVLLLPYERVVFSDRAVVIQKNEKTSKRELDMWRKSSVSFDNVMIKDVLMRLGTLFDMRISASSEKVNRYLLKADFSGMNLPDILEILETSLDISYEINGDHITLKAIDNP